MTTDNQGLPQDQRDSEALKPCPFCGSGAEHIHVYAGEEIVRCVAIDDCGVGFAGDNEEELRHVWNTRAVLSANAEAIRSAGFKDAIDAIRGAIEFGKQGTNHAPTEHWLAEFWDIGSKLARPAPEALPEVSEATRQKIIEEFLSRTGQYVTNDASRIAAIESGEPFPTGWCRICKGSCLPGMHAAPEALGAAKGELSDAEIRDVAVNYGAFMTVGEYDITKFDCEEDFFNCVRAILARAKGEQS